MNLTIKINCDNAAFGPDYEAAAIEAGRILGKIAQRFTNGIDGPEDGECGLGDINGNKVGYVKWTGATRKWLEERA